MKQLVGRVAVVTGASSGIGRATSLALAREGCHLALVDIDEDGLASAAAEVRSLGRDASTHVVDVASRAQMQALVGAVLTAHRHAHIVVNNAGVGVASDIVNHDLDDFEWLFGINFWGVVHGTRFFLPTLLAEEEGHIVNISSMFGLIGLPSQSAYCSSKFAVRGFTESLRAELVGTRVGATSVHPGGINTNIAKSSRIADGDLKERAVRFFATKTLPPSHAADLIVGAIKHDKARLLIAPEAYATDLLKRAFPSLTSELVARARKLVISR